MLAVTQTGVVLVWMGGQRSGQTDRRASGQRDAQVAGRHAKQTVKRTNGQLDGRRDEGQAVGRTGVA